MSGTGGWGIVASVATVVAIVGGYNLARPLLVARAYRAMAQRRPAVDLATLDDLPPGVRDAAQLPTVLVARGFAYETCLKVVHPEGTIVWYVVYRQDGLGTDMAFAATETFATDHSAFHSFASAFDFGGELLTVDGGAERLLDAKPGQVVVDAGTDDVAVMLDVHLAAVAAQRSEGREPVSKRPDGLRDEMMAAIGGDFDRRIAVGDLLPTGDGAFRPTWRAALAVARRMIGVHDRLQARRLGHRKQATTPASRVAAFVVVVLLVASGLGVMRVRAEAAARAAEAVDANRFLMARVATDYDTDAAYGAPAPRDGAPRALGLDAPVRVWFRDEADQQAFLAKIRATAAQVARAHRGMVDAPEVHDAFMGGRAGPTRDQGYVVVHLSAWPSFQPTTATADPVRQRVAFMHETAGRLRAWADARYEVEAGWLAPWPAETIQLRVERDGPHTLTRSQDALMTAVQREAERRSQPVGGATPMFLLTVSDATYPQADGYD